MAGWKTSYLLGWLPGRCYVGCREGMFSTFKSQKEIDQSAPKNHGSFLFHTSNFFPPWTSRCRRYFLGSVGNFRQEIHTFHTIHGTGIFTYMHGWLLMVNVGTWMVYDGMGYSFFFFFFRVNTESFGDPTCWEMSWYSSHKKKIPDLENGRMTPKIIYDCDRKGISFQLLQFLVSVFRFFRVVPLGSGLQPRLTGAIQLLPHAPNVEIIPAKTINLLMDIVCKERQTK